MFDTNKEVEAKRERLEDAVIWDRAPAEAMPVVVRWLFAHGRNGKEVAEHYEGDPVGALADQISTMDEAELDEALNELQAA